MTTEEQPKDVTVNDVGAKVSNLRDAVLAGVGPGAAASASGAQTAAKGGMAVAKNMAGVYARQMMKSSWIAQTDGQLLTDILPVLEGGCIYLPGFLCEPNDYSLMQALTRELDEHSKRTGSGVINWSQHHKYDNPEFSPTFQLVLRRLEQYFDVEILATRYNIYADASAWKPMHTDSHAYGANGKKEDFTMGASFGFTRQLAFKHNTSGQVFEFPQGNGDVFAFTSEVNSKFQHGVPKVKGNPERVGPRFSIIAWGRRRTLNERNSSETARAEQQPLRAPSPPESSGGGGGGYHHGHKAKPAAKMGEAPAEQVDAVALPEIEKAKMQPPPIDMDTVAQLVEKMVLQEQQKQQAKAKPGASKPAAASAASKASSGTGTAAAEGDKAKAAGGARRRGRVQHSWAS